MAMASTPALAESESEPESRYFVGAYAGRAAEDRLLEIVTRYNTGFIDSWLAAVAPGFVHWRGERLRTEVEGQVVRHWGEQDHWEFNLSYAVRWMRFPWDHHVDTRVAMGLGASWANEVPFIEPRAKELGEEESTRFLGYVMLEIELAPPQSERVSGFVRLHHRSGASGLFSDIRGGSNFITGGLRYYFD